MRTRTLPATLAAILLTLVARALADFTGQVTAVKDGDTIVVLRDTTPVTIRLNGIDCPEKAQAFGQKAKSLTSALVFGKIVTVREKNQDRYGRTVGDVILADGRNLNHALVRAGLAWWYKQYAPKDSKLAALEDKARAAQLGLWSDPSPVPPWQWRRKPRE